ncbi:response regulator [Kibdelosporangium phytohabitans]|uniref:LuxR family transcriptional regulator n=1 Tax=Kibdelosporangium phytohabitans TaxID=860235 RepID=A0A0N9HYQ6_9PSEU|nr:response regulator transcription factor [Kibdelosporangium phytohabitans]ALG10709.1 LuxR family transcriptional regulator [Kibdelosporangium phytohabitans]MBE1461846.1 DNA-binding NarL/FixJ family response regulator [Kibdelosporangium phytohabitans]
MSGPPTTTVLVVDDEVLIRAGLATLMRAAPGLDVVGEAADGREAVALAAEKRPDVILMDIRMPVMDGIKATEKIMAAATGPKPRVIVLTTFDLDEYVYAALRAGASGFLLKETEPRQVIAAVHSAAAGDMLFAPSVTRRLVEAYVGKPRRLSPPQIPNLTQLTPRELEILQLVGTGRTNNEIAGDLTVSEATIKTHLNRTMTKLGLTSRAQAVVVAYETGLVTPRDQG